MDPERPGAGAVSVQDMPIERLTFEKLEVSISESDFPSILVKLRTRSEFNTLRAEFNTLIKDSDASVSAGAELLKKAWRAGSNYNRSVPPPFESTSLSPVLEAVAGTLFRLERNGTGLSNDSLALENGSNILLTGVKGIGKTTVCKVTSCVQHYQFLTFFPGNLRGHCRAMCPLVTILPRLRKGT